MFSLRQSLVAVARTASVSRAATAPRASPLLARSLSRSAVALGVSKRYTEDHEWIEFDDVTQIGRIGVTDYAQKALGDVVFIELPTLETVVKAGEQIGAVESVKAASDIFAPVSGQIASVNATLGDQPGLLNQSPEADGYLATIKLSDPAEFEALMTAEAYTAHCEGH